MSSGFDGVSWRQLACVLSLVCVTGCGGGGGTAASPPETVPVPPASTTTGLVPVQGPLGDVLYQEAKTLRPLRDGAAWVYREKDYATGITSELRSTQALRAAGVFRETDSDDPTTPTDVRIGANGDVLLSATLSLAPGAAAISIVDAVELRSPVRAGDQMVLVDQKLAKSGLDFDKDGKDDAVDVALWRKVAGKELVSLPNRAEPIVALRVDSTAVFRLQPSAGGATQTVTTNSSAWYAPGLGLVRQASRDSGSTRSWDSDQTLIGYDGIEQGYGYVAAPLQTAWRSPAYIPQPLVLPQSIVLAENGGLRVLDLKGNSKAVLAFPGGVAQALGQTGTTAWARVARSVDSNTVRHDFYRLANDGTPEAAPFLTLDPLDSEPAGSFNTGVSFASVPGGNLIWTYVLRTVFGTNGGQTRQEIVIRRHDLKSWVGAEVKLPVTEQLGVGSGISVQAQAGGLWVTWNEFNTSAQQTQHVAMVSSAGAVSASSVLPLPSLIEGSAPTWSLVGGGSTPWALWWGNGPAGQPSAHGVRLDATASLVDTAASLSALAAAELPALSGLSTPLQAMQNLGVGASVWMFAGRGSGLVDPDDKLPQAYLDVRQLDPGSGAPARTLKATASYRLPGRNLLCAPIVQAGFSLLLTDSSGYVSPVIVWH